MDEDMDEDEPGTDPIQTIFQAIGQASTCWVGGTGGLVFDGDAAVACAETLINDLLALGVTFPERLPIPPSV
jgi:hypothetical protein